MNHPPGGTVTHAIPDDAAATLCIDGYVRLTLHALLAIPLAHLISGVDEDPPGCDNTGATSAAISGYTEWISTTVPTLTIGWDWELCTRRSPPSYLRLGPPRSNVMLIDGRQRDLGPAETEAGLESLIDATEWQEMVKDYITMRYI